MTKIAFDPTANQADRHTSNTVDLARRLEWRLQWEKAQVESWQRSHHMGGQQTDTSKSSAEAGERCLKEQYAAFTPIDLASDRIPADTADIPGTDRSGNYQAELVYESSLAKQSGKPSVHTVIVPADVKGAGQSLSIMTKTAQSARPMPMPANQQAKHAGVHIYQVDGKVEVALRNTGLNGQDGVMLMKELKSDLASLGLRLTRLILNGELLWQTETPPPKGLAFAETETDEAPIDEIY